MNKRLTLLLACLFLMVGMAMAQTKVSGTVLGESDGQPVVGASVKVIGTRTGTVTDSEGNFSITVPSSATHLEISYIGMSSKVVKIRGNMKIFLQDDNKTLDEVMVVAYGKQKKSAFTGSAGVIGEKTLNTRVISNATNALAGQVAGVQILNTSGQPGSSATIRVRGIGSISSSNAPLIVVDGVPYEGSISSINPTDISSMTVLKDAASNAIYGARGANGVVLITTKSGNTTEAQITFDAKWGTNSRCVPQYDVISNPGQYYETQFKALYNSKAYHGYGADAAYAYANKNLFDEKNGGLGYQVYTVPAGQNLIGTNFKLNPNAKLGYSDGDYYYTPDDWYNEAFSTNLRQEYNATVSGKGERLTYYGSVGYLDDSGLIKNSGFKRYSARANVDYQAKKWLRIGTNMAYSYADSQAPSGQTSDDWGSSGNLFYVVNTIAPIYPLYVRNADGSIKMNEATGKPVYDASTTTNFHRPNVTGNAVRDIDYNTYNDYRDLLTGKWYAQITPIEGLVLTANIAANVQNDRTNRLYSTFGSNSSVDGAAYVYSQRMLSVNNQYMADYSHTFAAKHNFEILAGYEQYRMKSQFLSGYNDHLYDPFIGELSNAGGTDMKTTYSYTDKYMSEGIFSRLQYDYDGKYFGSISYRHDASSRFAKANRWGDFGSVGAAWLLTKENFMKDISWVDLLKFKISWGKQGNDNILNPFTGDSEYYAYMDQYTPKYSNGNYSLTMTYKGNKDLTWETSYSFNTGFDFELFNHRLNGSFEYWSRKTDDLLYNKPVPPSSGITTGSVPYNIGSVLNHGIELSLDGTIVKTKDLNWSVNFNLTQFKSEIKSLAPELEAQGGQKGGYWIRRVGGSMQEAYLVRWAGVDPETGEGLYYVDPDNGDWSTTSNYSTAKHSIIGDVLPKVYGGFGTRLDIYGFDIAAMFSYQLGGKYYDGTYQAFMHTGMSSMAGTNWSKDILNAWTPSNRYTDVPRLDASDNSYQIDSDRWLISSDYLSINNITVGYTVNKSLLRKIGLSALRVYVSGDNLGVISARKGLDPRGSFGLGSSTYGSGASQSSYSLMRTIVGGVQLTF
jgi:TonB-linked SusC/RagA family outer membrane protein